MPHSIPRLLQQQPQRYFSREQQQQQQSGSTDFQPSRARLEAHWDSDREVHPTASSAAAAIQRWADSSRKSRW